MSVYKERFNRMTDYSLYYLGLIVILTITGFLTGILGLLTIYGFKLTADLLGMSNDYGYMLLDKVTLIAFVVFYLVYQYAGIRIIYKEGVRDIDSEIKAGILNDIKKKEA